MREAAIVSVARTPIGKAYRGVFNDTQPQTLAGHSIAAAVERAGVDPVEIEDVLLGCASQAGEDSRNIARHAALLAGLPVSVPGQTVNRLCGSGLAAVLDASRAITVGEDIRAGRWWWENPEHKECGLHPQGHSSPLPSSPLAEKSA